MASNIGLIKNNVAVASKIALHLNGMSGKKSEVVITKPPIASKIFRMGTPPKITVIGATAIDLTGKPEIPLQKDTSAPGVISVSFGGVARNVYETLMRLRTPENFITAFGNDHWGNIIKDHFEKISSIGGDFINQVTGDYRSAVFQVIVDHDGSLNAAVADMGITEKISPSKIKELWNIIKDSKIIFMRLTFVSNTILHNTLSL